MTLPTDVKERAVAAYANGRPLAEICRRYQISIPALAKWVKARGVPLREPAARPKVCRGGRPPKIGRVELTELVARGLTVDELAGHFNAHPTSVRAAKRRFGLAAILTFWVNGTAPVPVHLPIDGPCVLAAQVEMARFVAEHPAVTLARGPRGEFAACAADPGNGA